MSNIMELIDAYAAVSTGAVPDADRYKIGLRIQEARAAVVEAVEKLEKDAARYRWLRDKSWAVYLKEGPDSHGWFPSDGEDIDAAADAAMEATNGQDS